jgi:hypothetical protein
MKIPLTSNNLQHKFTFLIEALNPILRLKRREKEVLLYYLLKYNDLCKTPMSEEAIATVLISTDCRQEVREKVKMSEPSFNNHILQLKRKGIMVEGKLIPLLIKILRTQDFNIEYNVL